MRLRAVCLFMGLVASLGIGAAANAADCPGNPGALGTSRTLVVDPAEHRLLGTMQYRETLPLEDKEVVLTFDDGPIPQYSSRVLATLASECVKATYFLVGRMARAYPDMVRRIEADGHTLGTHSQNHPLSFHRMPLARAQQEIEDGIASVGAALGGNDKVAPFFRIPGLLRADGVEDYLATRHIMTWSADFPADDWKKVGAQEVLNRALSRLEAKGKGVLLLHDIQPATVLALPTLLKELKARGYRIVHVVPASASLARTPTVATQWLMRPPKLQVVAVTWPNAGDALGVEVAASRLATPGLDTIGPAALRGVAAAEAAPTPANGRTARPSRWPLRIALPSTIEMMTREELPIPHPDSFGYASTLDRWAVAPDRRASLLRIDDTPRPLAAGDGNDLTGAIRPSLGRWPVTTASVPKAAFP